jgi:ribosome modulation factor
MKKTDGTRAGLLATALLMLAMSGCASMNKAECLNVDWATVGYEDGVAGRSGERIGEHRKACAKHGVTPDFNAYQAGREQGLREYCQPETGYQLGVNGYALKTSCPADVKEDFESAYHSGYELYAMRARVVNAQNELESVHRELAQIDQDLVAVSAIVVARDTDNVARAQALLDAKNMAQRKGQLKARIPELERIVQESQRELDNYVASTGGAR